MSTVNSVLPAERQELLAEVDLQYVSDLEPGYRRRRCGRGFVYLDTQGKIVHDHALQKRIQALVIPPAWQDVWICADPNGHLQATGRDEAGRKQYLYHPSWAFVREQTKFSRLLEFAKALPALRAQVEADLHTRGLTQNKVLALVVRLLETTLIRIGNEEYERQNGSHGLTTLRDKHVEVSNSAVIFEFRGKSGKEHEIVLDNPRLARLVKACQELPGQRLFQYRDESGDLHPVDSGTVNDYLHRISGCGFTAKEFRTWGGTVQALRQLRSLGPAGSESACKRQITVAIKAVAAHLGNTPAVCRQHYVHPCVVDAYQTGKLEQLCAQIERRPLRSPHSLQGDEAVVLFLLRRYARERQETKPVSI